MHGAATAHWCEDFLVRTIARPSRRGLRCSRGLTTNVHLTPRASETVAPTVQTPRVTPHLAVASLRCRFDTLADPMGGTAYRVDALGVR